MLDLEYTEIDGLLYPNIETGMENIENDLSSQNRYRRHWLETHPMPLEDTLERIRR